MGTPILFHGPGSRDKAVSWSIDTGRPVSEPIGDNGLKVDDSRLIVALANQGGVGDKPPTLVIGPVDRATVEAADALLKTLEDLAEGPLRIALWADFLIGVSLTIRSRTQTLWCPGVVRFPRSVKQAAENIIKASRLGTGVLETLCPALDEHDPEILLDALVSSMGAEDISLWEKLRPMLGAKWVSSKTAFIDTLLGY